MSNRVASTLPGCHWDLCEASAPRRSARWGATDRGWLFHGCKTSLGHYLDYGPEPTNGEARSPEGNVHAVAIGHETLRSPGGRVVGCTTWTKASRYFRTSEEARAWLESLAGAS